MENSIITKRADVDYSRHAYTALKIAFVVAPLLAGLDKFFNVLTVWTNYVAPIFPNMLNVSAGTFMIGVGIVEIIAGIGVLLKPKIFAYIVSAWLIGIILNLVIHGGYLDIALRDLGLSIGAYALGQLAHTFEPTRVKSNRSIFHRHDKNLSYP